MNADSAGPTRSSNRVDPSYRLLGIVGSLRSQAYSRAVLLGVADAAPPKVQFEFSDIGSLPHFNQDLYVEPLPDVVAAFRDQILRADGIIISSPEYNHGIPGCLKNALDWASRPHNGSPMRDKPILIMTSSPAFTGGVRAQYQIRETLVSALAKPVSTPEIVVGLVAAKVTDGRLVDEINLKFALDGLDTMLVDIDRVRESRSATLVVG